MLVGILKNELEVVASRVNRHGPQLVHQTHDTAAIALQLLRDGQNRRGHRQQDWMACWTSSGVNEPK